MFYSKDFYGMRYPFDKCERERLLSINRCLECSVRRFCKAPERVEER
ncbi:hypothetical protein LCGC14_1154340 [marine sediment metagenome]|uniref:Uncharacterized protein n=1 Tax=marine sediment metagenome TaxID=412755 RepID=A0A0F9Q024_9ZZZZ